ncbi:MAG: hypothetical protein HQK63_02375 [Desulfamplus sp.]|nr:hypothetical protein [Desulfamplus sp.]
MNSRTTKSFWKHYWGLPLLIRQKAIQSYKLWRDNPAHPAICFKRVKESQPIYSVRIGLSYRALGLFKSDTVTWFWIGDHDAYEYLINEL